MTIVFIHTVFLTRLLQLVLPIATARDRIPGILQARGRFEDVLLNVPIQPLKDAMNERYLVYGRRNKRAFTGPPMTIRLVDEEGLPMQNGSPFSVVRAIPGNIRLHPLKQVPVGVGFVLAPPDERIRIRVPVVPTNREKCPGLDSGGWVNRLHWAVDMVVDPGVPTPLCVTMDLSGLELRGRKSIADLEFPGKGNGCKLLLPDDELCIIISKV